MNVKNIALATYIMLSLISNANAAEDSKDNASPLKTKIGNLTFNPVIMDTGSDESQSLVLGLEYEFKGKILEYPSNKTNTKTNVEDNREIEPVNIENPSMNYTLGYLAKGTLASSAKRNPKNLLEFELNGSKIFAANDGHVTSGKLALQYETDQEFKNKNLVYGLGGGLIYTGILSPKAPMATNETFDGKKYKPQDNLILTFLIGSVDPQNDTERETILGTKNLDSYARLSFDLHYGYSFYSDNPYLRQILIDHKFRQEINADQKIKNAKLDQFNFTNIKFSLLNNFYLAYGYGNFPFNEKKDSVYTLGFTTNFLDK